MKKFILSAVLLTMLTATYAQYTIQIIPIIDRRIEFGVLNMFNIYSLTGAEEAVSNNELLRYNDVEGGFINPGAYFGYGYTIDMNSRDFSVENLYKVGMFSNKYTLIGETTSFMGQNTPGSTLVRTEYDKLYLHIQGEVMAKFHLMRDQLELGVGVAGVFQLNLKDIGKIKDVDFDATEEPIYSIYPVVKGIYKIDQLYFSATAGVDLFQAFDFNILRMMGLDNSVQHVKVVPILFNLSVGYLW